MLRIFYEHCEIEWEDIWECACDSECPKCGADIEASDWEEFEEEEPEEEPEEEKDAPKDH